ncbi:MAG TPA: TetR/AcrR family transcriptional regulator [Actinomycetaceae bacterium]|nr:TetR/AcrR family transcriptional regulator [Actinomycetaceae bacterium]
MSSGQATQATQATQTSQTRATRSRANTRARLLDAAAEVFVAHGIEGASVDELVAAAGFTRGAFYSNFSSMNEVFQDFFTVVVREILTAVSDAVAAMPADEIDIESILGVLDSIPHSDRNTYVLTRELELFALRDEDAAAVYSQYLDTLYEYLDPIVTAALTRLGRRPTLPVRELSHALVALYIDSLSREVHGEDAATVRRSRTSVFKTIVLAASEPVEPGTPA